MLNRGKYKTTKKSFFEKDVGYGTVVAYSYTHSPSLTLIGLIKNAIQL